MSDDKFLGKNKNNAKSQSEAKSKKLSTDEKEDLERVAGDINTRMKEDEQEMTMLKDCASLIAEAKLEAEAEKKEKSLDAEDIMESIMSKNINVKPTGGVKILKFPGDQSENKTERSKGSIAADRLLEDKTYLSNLSKRFTQNVCLNNSERGDNVYKGVKDTAEEALQFLKDREDFWDQLALGSDKRNTKGGEKYKPTKALESTRLIF